MTAAETLLEQVRSLLSWTPDHDGSDPARVEQDYMHRAQLADMALELIGGPGNGPREYALHFTFDDPDREPRTIGRFDNLDDAVHVASKAAPGEHRQVMQRVPAGPWMPVPVYAIRSTLMVPAD